MPKHRDSPLLRDLKFIGVAIDRLREQPCHATVVPAALTEIGVVVQAVTLRVVTLEHKLGQFWEDVQPFLRHAGDCDAARCTCGLAKVLRRQGRRGGRIGGHSVGSQGGQHA